ncbi:MAG: phosphoribosyl-AMP cyclohydrolase [Zetaproteobacteria bacterium CG_4_9_14_3_um_filter_53_7]|nr:MAG: phosphoribosyl-AMP cyclohydrolase [Zetaproteobacteria bacterium CG_4_9_14_3_um_filter_53_7]
MQDIRMSLLDSITFNEAGLVPAIAQDAATGRVLMMAWMNVEAFEQTLKTGFAHYYSRSRSKQWMKGESSGHVQKVVGMYLDCDGDTLLLKIEQTGPACHTNRESCFYKQEQHGQWVTIEEPMT